MPRNRRSKNSKKKQQPTPSRYKQPRKAQHHPSDNDDNNDTTTRRTNFVSSAGPGCHMARMDNHDRSSQEEEWVLEWESVDPDEFGHDLEHTIPEIALDPEASTLTVCNIHAHDTLVAYVTIFEWTLRNRQGQILEQGSSTNEQNVTRPCTTLIVLCPPQTFCHLVTIDELPETDPSEWEHYVESDVQAWRKHTAVDDFYHKRTVGFPLDGPGPFLCTQGVGGHLTHFFEGNQHAIDFRCPTGTPLRAAGDGIVRQVEIQHHHVTGIAVSNLFQWNAILIELDDDDDDDDKGKDDKQNEDRTGESATTTITNTKQSSTDLSSQRQPPPQSTTSNNRSRSNEGPLFVEYVHIATTTVQVGDRVKEGQIIGTSGGRGFSPEDHLHFAAYRSGEPHAATVGFQFHSVTATATNTTSNPANADEDTKGTQHKNTTTIDHNRSLLFQPVAGEWYNLHGKQAKPKESSTI